MEVHVAVDLELPPVATSAGEARRTLRDALAGAESGDSVDAAELAISEIVTNALVHAGTPMRLRVLLQRSGVRVELRDGSPHLPHRRDYSSVAVTGRGLHMVAQMVDRWGAYLEGGGKVVWFEIVDDDQETGDVAGQMPVRQLPDSDGSIEIELMNMPLLMHAAWQEHAAALLRELMLVRLDQDLSALEQHAGASDALSVLFEQVPVPDLGQDPEAIMGSATEPAVSLGSMTLRVPRVSLSHFDLLDDLLEDAVTLADQGKLLSPPTQPEIRVMRQWICEQVRSQSRGGASRAWASPGDAQPPLTPVTLDWDPAEVNSSGRALLTADDANLIIAASPSALATLGYDDLADLVGKRLITIIPLRYHQAHIAGFTLHLINGRSPLLGQRVTVPALRADGTEEDLELELAVTPLPSGRRVFTAEFLG